MKFTANWKLEGFMGKTLETGGEIDAKPIEVRQFVAKKYGGDVHDEESATLVPSVVVQLKSQLAAKTRELEADMRRQITAAGAE